MSVVLQGRDLAYSVGAKGQQRQILSGVNVQLHSGEVLGLIGPNGAGKSTLLGLLAGDLRPGCGTVLVDGQDYAGISARQAARLRSVMLQDSRVSFSYSVRDVVAMGRAAWPKEPAADAARIAAALAEVDLTGMEQRDITTLSGGERARAALARVIVQDAQCVLLDEPTAAMDIGHSEKTMGTIRRLTAQGRGVAVVIHDLETAARHCDRLVLLAEGGIYAEGSPQQVCTAENLTAVYGWPVRTDFTAEGPWIRPGSLA